MSLPELPKDLVPIRRDDYDCRMTVEEFNHACNSGMITSDDGVGYFATKTHYSRSHSAWSPRPPWAHYVLWLNK